MISKVTQHLTGHSSIPDHKLNRIWAQETFKSEHKHKFDQLTRREIEVVSRIVEGLSSADIADRLFISEHTVAQHRKNINRKLQVNTISDLFQYALAFDLI